MVHRVEADDGIKGSLAKNDGGNKSSNVYEQDGFFGEFLISIKNGRDEDDKNEKTHKFGAEIIGVFAIIGPIIKSPEEGRGDGDFDMFPSGFINGGEEAENFVFVAQIIEKVSEGAKRENNNDADNGKKRMVHEDIIALER